MRFIVDGPDIPDELIEQALAGRAVFLCGAGVSHRAGLPMFEGLTEKIYTRLGETRANDPAEQEAFGSKEYDRVLRALEKRLLRVGDRSRVRDACAAELAPPKRKNLPDHGALIALSRDKDGRTRLLTTNFDTLFERAARRARVSVVSHAVKAMPKPASHGDHGILHLHGRIADKGLRLSESDLVLTSADFGDAYLRDGWASQYIEDRIRTGTLVLVGYSANDAALRLLLDTIDVDRQRFPDLHKIYALDKATSTSKAIWDAKGTIAVEATDYDILYATVREWSRYAADPHRYATVRVAEILSKDPRNASDFEREQLSFLIAHDDAQALLLANNPSLAWLPTLADLKLVGTDQPWLAAWIENNLENPDAVKDIVSNIALLGRRVGNVLEYRLHRRTTRLAEPFDTAWKLIVRHLKGHDRDGVSAYDSGWFDLLSRLGRNERTAEVLDQVVTILVPRVKVSKRFSLDETRGAGATNVRDLMAVDFETDENIDVGELLNHWPADLPKAEDVGLLNRLTEALAQRLDDAAQLGLEHDGQFSATDADVPSVADHDQNNYRHGFLPIVRVLAEVWSNLARKDTGLAEQYVARWGHSGHKLMRRLALFAAAEPAVSPATAADTLSQLPLMEHFFSNTTVELFRLLHARWADLPAATRSAIEERFAEGPPPNAFREGADLARIIDRSRYEDIGYLIQWDLALSPPTVAVFDDLRQRYPEWGLQPPDRAGFHSWVGPVRSVGTADLGDLENVNDADLVAAATALDARTPFGDGNSWATLASTDPERALRALVADRGPGQWNAAVWQPLLWSRSSAVGPGFAAALAATLLAWPDASFADIAGSAANWLNTAQGLEAGDDFWRLWDKVFSHLPTAEDNNDPERYFDQAINSPAGNLAEALLKKMSPVEGGPSFGDYLRPRLTSLLRLGGHSGALAKVRLAADVAFLHTRAPEWTIAHIVPLFYWEQPLALAAWSARRYANTIGSPAIFELTKGPFLAMFERADVPAKLKEEYSDWLVVPLFSNQAHQTGYPLTMVEAKAALRRIGPNALWQIGHRFAIEMEAAAADEKLATWREVVGPIFRGTWPFDAELQTSRANFKLVQMLRATGEAFPEAVDDVIPLIARESSSQGSTVFSLKDADPSLYELAPRKLLDLVDAVVGHAEAGSIYGLRRVLDRLVEADTTIVGSPKYQRLLLLASREG